MPVKDTQTKNKAVGIGQMPRPLHGRHARTETCFRWVMAVTHNRYKFVTVSLPKRPRNGRFRSEAATWIQKWFKVSVGASRKL
jgi:hypothetical protein